MSLVIWAYVNFDFLMLIQFLNLNLSVNFSNLGFWPVASNPSPNFKGVIATIKKSQNHPFQPPTVPLLSTDIKKS